MQEFGYITVLSTSMLKIIKSIKPIARPIKAKNKIILNSIVGNSKIIIQEIFIKKKI